MRYCYGSLRLSLGCRNLRDHFVAQKLEPFEDIDRDPVVGVDVERLDDVAKADRCFQP